MFIETNEVVFETFFRYAQVEITGICNMRCQHCRASNEMTVNMPLEIVEKILQFSKENSQDNFCLTISGGEPFCHPQLLDIVDMSARMNIMNVAITTNGSLVTSKKISELEGVGIKNFRIQVSIDSVCAQKHDSFRRYKKAFDKAINCLKMIAKSKILPSLRMAVLPSTIAEMDQMIKLAVDCGVKSVDFSPVIPVGRGEINRELVMTPWHKKTFFEKLAFCIEKYPDMNITTEDPLQFAAWNPMDLDNDNLAFFGGCAAGITSFSANSVGDITACALLTKVIINVRDKTVQEISQAYTTSEIIRALAIRKYSGKCGDCKFNRLCGGCRAVAEGLSGNYLSADETCWL